MPARTSQLITMSSITKPSAAAIELAKRTPWLAEDIEQALRDRALVVQAGDVSIEVLERLTAALAEYTGPKP